MNSMTSNKKGAIALILAAAVSTLSWAEGDTVLSPAKRLEGLEKAKKMLAVREIPTATADPFHPEAFLELVSGSASRVAGPVTPVNVVVPGPRTEREILQAIAASLKPSGNFILGGQPTLVFGQKRVKAGGLLTITFEGTEYTLEVTSIERTNFTLRLNREEFTRPIK
jgi:hypothetical protein